MSVPNVDYGQNGIVLRESYGPFTYHESIGTAEVDELIEELERAKRSYRREFTYHGDKE